MLLLSIIVPMYKSEKYLPKCLDSLIHQDIDPRDYEIILVNDGSPDGSLNIAEEYARRFTNIVVISKENGGASSARNAGIRKATGKYLYFVDPDDYVLENSLRDLLDTMEKENLDVLRFAFTEVNENGETVSSVKHPQRIDYSSQVMDGYTFMAERLGAACYVWTYLFRASIIQTNEILFDEGVYYDDTPWLPRVLSKAARVDSVDWKRHFYLIRDDSLVRGSGTSQLRRKLDGQRGLIAELLRQMAGTANEAGRLWYGMMLSHCALGLLSLIAEVDFSNRSRYIKELKQEKVFPLSKFRCSRRNRIKIAITNFSPSAFCWYCHLRLA